MAVTMKEVRAALEPDEPDYDKAKRLGPDALPHLRTLIKGTDTMMAAKAASLAGVIGGKRAVGVLTAAADNSDIAVRQAAAYSAARMEPEHAEPVLLKFLDDRDSTVVRRAAISAQSVPRPALAEKLQAVAKSRRAKFATDAARASLRVVSADLKSKDG